MRSSAGTPSAAAYAWHDGSFDWNANQVVGQNVLAKRGSVTGLGAQTVLARRSGASLMASADARYTTAAGTDASGAELLTRRGGFQFGGQAEGAANLWSFMHVNLHADANEQWNEAPITVHEGGTMSGAIGRLFLFPKNRVVLIDTGAQARQLKIAAEGTPSKPSANQFLGWAGIDFNLWATPTRVVRAEVLDEKLVRRVYLSDAGVIAYRHYELWTDATPDFRIALAPRASIDNATLIVRKALAGGRVGFDIHGGGGYDNIRDRILAQAGAAFVLAASWSTRLQASYDMSHETATGLPGTLQIGWLTLHVDI